MSGNRRTIIQLSPPKTNNSNANNNNGFQVRVPSVYANRTETLIQTYLDGGGGQRVSSPPTQQMRQLNLNNNNISHFKPNNQRLSLEEKLSNEISNISNQDVTIKSQSLYSLINYTANPANHQNLLSHGIISQLVSAISVEEEVCSSYAFLSLSNLSMNSPSNQRLITNSGVLSKIPLFLSHNSSVNIITNIIMLLTNLSCSDENVEKIAANHIISNIIHIFDFIPETLCYSSLLMLQNTLSSQRVMEELIDGGELKKLIDGVIRFPDNKEIVNTFAMMISSLSYDDNNSIKLVDLGILSILSLQLKSSDLEILRHSLASLTNLSADQVNREKICEAGAIARVIELLESSDFDILENAIMMLSNLSNEMKYANMITEIGIEQIATLFQNLNENLQIRVSKLLSILSQFEMPRYKIQNHGQLMKFLKMREQNSNHNLAYYCNVSLKRLSVPSSYFPKFKHADRLSLSPEKAEKNRLHRIKVIQEIIDTERTYTAHLIAVNQFFMKPLREFAESGKPLISDHHYKEIFGGLDILCNMHTSFLQNIEKVAIQNGSEEVPIGDVFLDLVACLRLYRNYISNYDKAVDTLSFALENKKFKQFISDQTATYHTLGISSILITPIQRIPRYSLLLQDLVKHMTEDHPDFKKVNEALNGVLVVADYLDEEKGKTEAVNKVISIQEKVDNLPIKLVEPHRYFVKEGDLISEPNTKSSDLFYCYFFLFSDLLVVCKQSGSKFKFKKFFYLHSIKVVPMPDETKQNAFRILTQDDGITYTAPSKNDRDSWVNTFNCQIYEEKKNNVQRRVASQTFS